MRINNLENNKRLKYLIHPINSKQRRLKYNNHLDYNNLLRKRNIKKATEIRKIKWKAKSSMGMINKKATRMIYLRKNQCQKRKHQY